MRLIIEPDYEKMSKWAANYVAKCINEAKPTAEKPFKLGYIDKWFERVDALQKKLDIIARNVSELKTDEEFVNLQKIVGTMTNKGEEIQKDIKVALEYCQKTVEKMFSSIGTGDGNGV